MAIEFQVTFDSADPAEHASFWAEALRYIPQLPPCGFDSWDAVHDARGVLVDRRNDSAALIDPQGVGPRLLFKRVPESAHAAENAPVLQPQIT